MSALLNYMIELAQLSKNFSPPEFGKSQEAREATAFVLLLHGSLSSEKDEGRLTGNALAHSQWSDLRDEEAPHFWEFLKAYVDDYQNKVKKVSYPIEPAEHNEEVRFSIIFHSLDRLKVLLREDKSQREVKAAILWHVFRIGQAPWLELPDQPRVFVFSPVDNECWTVFFEFLQVFVRCRDAIRHSSHIQLEARDNKSLIDEIFEKLSRDFSKFDLTNIETSCLHYQKILKRELEVDCERFGKFSELLKSDDQVLNVSQCSADTLGEGSPEDIEVEELRESICQDKETAAGLYELMDSEYTNHFSEKYQELMQVFEVMLGQPEVKKLKALKESFRICVDELKFCFFCFLLCRKALEPLKEMLGSEEMLALLIQHEPESYQKLAKEIKFEPVEHGHLLFYAMRVFSSPELIKLILEKMKGCLSAGEFKRCMNASWLEFLFSTIYCNVAINPNVPMNCVIGYARAIFQIIRDQHPSRVSEGFLRECLLEILAFKVNVNLEVINFLCEKLSKFDVELLGLVLNYSHSSEAFSLVLTHFIKHHGGGWLRGLKMSLDPASNDSRTFLQVACCVTVLSDFRRKKKRENCVSRALFSSVDHLKVAFARACNEEPTAQEVIDCLIALIISAVCFKRSSLVTDMQVAATTQLEKLNFVLEREKMGEANLAPHRLAMLCLNSMWYDGLVELLNYALRENRLHDVLGNQPCFMSPTGDMCRMQVGLKERESAHRELLSNLTLLLPVEGDQGKFADQLALVNEQLKKLGAKIAVSLHPNFLFKQCKLLYSAKKYKEAAISYAKIKPRNNDDHSKKNLNIGLCQMRLENYKFAKICFEKGLKVVGKNKGRQVKLQYNLNHCLEKLKNLEKIPDSVPVEGPSLEEVSAAELAAREGFVEPALTIASEEKSARPDQAAQGAMLTSCCCTLFTVAAAVVGTAAVGVGFWFDIRSQIN